MAGIGIIHYKFKSAIQPESVEFDGHYISVGEVKRLIATKKGLSLEDACAELELSENVKGKAGKVYADDAQQLPRGTSVIVRRLPVQRSKALAGGRAAAAYAATAAAGGPLVGSSAPIMGDAEQEDFGNDPYEEQIAKQRQHMAEEDAVIGQVVAAQEQEWQHSSDPTVLAQARAARGRGAGRFQGGRFGGAGGRFGPTHGRPHDTYFCALCGAQGQHWKQDCPQKDHPDLDLRQVRAPAGIPSSMLARDAAGGLLLPNGEVGNVITDSGAFAREMGLVTQPKRNAPALPAPRAASLLPLPGPPGTAAAAGTTSRPTSAAARAAGGAADAEDADLLQGLHEEEAPHEEMEDHGAGLFDDEEDYLAPVSALSGGLGAGMLEAVAQQQQQQQEQQRLQQQQQQQQQQQGSGGTDQQESMSQGGSQQEQQQQRQPPASPAAAPPGQRSPAPAAGARSATPPNASAAPAPPSSFAELLPYIEDLLPKGWPQAALEEAFGAPRPLTVADWGQFSERLKEQGVGAPQQLQRRREEERRQQERGSRRHGSRRSRSRSRSRDGKDKRKRRERHRSSERSGQPQERRREREAPAAAEPAPQQQGQRQQQPDRSPDDLRHLLNNRAPKQAADVQQQQQQQQQAAAAAGSLDASHKRRAAAAGSGPQDPVAHSADEPSPKKQRMEAAAADRPADELMTGASGELLGLLEEDGPMAQLHLSNGGAGQAGGSGEDEKPGDWDAGQGASDRGGDAPGGSQMEDETGRGGGQSAEEGADAMDWGQAEQAQEGSEGNPPLQQHTGSQAPRSGSQRDGSYDDNGSLEQQEQQGEEEQQQGVQEDQEGGGSGRSRSGTPAREGRSASRSKDEAGRSPSRRHRSSRHCSSSRGRKEGERRRHRDKKDKKERKDKDKKSRHKRRDEDRSRSRSRSASPSRRRSSKRSRSRSHDRQQQQKADKPRRPAVERLGSRGSRQLEAAAGHGDAAAEQAPGKGSKRRGVAKLWQNQLAAGGIGIRK